VTSRREWIRVPVSETEMDGIRAQARARLAAKTQDRRYNDMDKLEASVQGAWGEYVYAKHYRLEYRGGIILVGPDPGWDVDHGEWGKVEVKATYRTGPPMRLVVTPWKENLDGRDRYALVCRADTATFDGMIVGHVDAQAFMAEAKHESLGYGERLTLPFARLEDPHELEHAPFAQGALL
jgi:hypothetical protein